MTVSVVLAAYNGEKHIGAQAQSVLAQLGAGDELIVSDDSPGGGTLKALKEACGEDSRIKYFKGEGKGVCRNFENALSEARGDIIFLCDQDDIWLDGKAESVLASIKNGADLVMHDAVMTDENLNPTGKTYFEEHGVYKGFAANFIRNSYKGCCMAFRREILDFALPFPQDIPMHDQWIALCALKNGKKIEILKNPLILHRRYEKSLTASARGGTLRQKIMWRISLFSALKSKRR